MMEKKKILLVDDDADLRKTIRLLFEEEFEIFEVSSGREGVKMLREKLPSLVLLDVAMPEQDGLETLAQMRPMSPSAIIIMLTGEGDLETASKALDMGAVAYITKPFDLEFLRAEVRRLMASDSSGEKKDSRPWRIED